MQQLTPPSSWHHCEGDVNPADLISRGILVQPLMDNPLWLKGPSSLSDTAFSMEEQKVR